MGNESLYPSALLREFKTYETFLCYRGGSIGHTVSLEIAKAVYGMIGTREEFGDVFFAEGSGVHYDFMKDAEPILRGVRKFIVVLCTDFFRGFFLPGGTPGELVPNPDSATFRELKLAFDFHCDLYPIFSGEFSWDRVDGDILRAMERWYGAENLDLLRHRANVYRWKQAGNSADEVVAYLSRVGMDGVRRFLRSLGDDASGNYELAVTEFANRNNQENMRIWLLDIVEHDAEEAVRYAAFYALQIMYRQLRDYSRQCELFRTYPAFSGHASYDHLWILHRLESGALDEPDALLERAYREAHRNAGDAGCLHLFADLFAAVCETREQDRERVDRRWGTRALEAVERAIALRRSYAKYHCTLGRILAIRGDLAAAGREVDLAIDLEDSRRSDYMLRLAGYQYHKIMIQVEKRMRSPGK